MIMLARFTLRPAVHLLRSWSCINCSGKQALSSKPVLYPMEIYPILSVPLRFKSKSKAKNKSFQISRDGIPLEVMAHIKEDDLIKEFDGVINRFQSHLQQRLTFKFNPQMIFDIHIPDANVSLGQVANLVIQTQGIIDKESANMGDQHILVDLSGRPDLMASARKAVINFLDPAKDGSGQSRVQACGSSAFSVRLNTIITQETRREMIARGHEMLNQVIRELDKVYQAHDKLIHGNPEAKRKFSEDHLYATRDYLRSLVKQQHAVATSIWQQKQLELERD